MEKRTIIIELDLNTNCVTTIVENFNSMRNAVKTMRNAANKLEADLNYAQYQKTEREIFEEQFLLDTKKSIIDFLKSKKNT